MRYPFVKVAMLFKHMSPFTWYVLEKDNTVSFRFLLSSFYFSND